MSRADIQYHDLGQDVFDAGAGILSIPRIYMTVRVRNVYVIQCFFGIEGTERCITGGVSQEQVEHYHIIHVLVLTEMDGATSRLS